MDLSTSQIRRALDQADTVGGKAGVVLRFRRVDTDLSDLSDDEIGELTRFLRQTDEDGVKLINDFDQATTKKFLSIGCAGSTFATTGPFVGAGTPAGTFQDDCIDADRFRRALKLSVNENGNLDSVDAADVVGTITGYDGSKQQRAALLVRRTRGAGGAEFLADASDSTIDDVLSLTLDTDGTPFPDDLAERVRVGLAKEYSRGHFSTDGWAGEVYPDADDSTEVAGTIARELNDLENTEGVQGLARVIGKDSDGGTGSYLVDLPAPGVSDKPVKGVALEIRVGSGAAGDLKDGEVLRLSYEPDVDFEELEKDEYGNALDKIAQRVYGNDDDAAVDDVKVDLGINDGSSAKQPEFDALRDSSNSDRETIYWEPKNRQTVEPNDVQDQASRFLASRVINGDTDLENTKMIVVTRTETEATDLNEIFQGDWFEAKSAQSVVENT